MNWKSVWTAVVIAAIFAAMVAFSPPGDRAEMGSLFALVAVIIGVQSIPAFRRFVLRHVRWTVAIGIGAILVGLLVLVAPLTRPVADKDLGASTWAFILLLLGGVFTILMPSTMRRFEADTAAWKSIKGRKPEPGGFHPAAEVKAILADLIGHKAALARVVGPWLLLFCLIPALAVFGADWKALLHRHRGLGVWVLLGFGVLIFLEIGLLLVAAIQWTRFAATRREPRLTAFPGKALWGWTWRWVVFGGLTRSLGQVEPWLKAHLPGAAPWQMDGLLSLIGFSALVLASPFALVLPAIALNAADKGTIAAMRGFRLVGRKYYLGVALILGPYSASSWVLNSLYENFKGPAVEAVSLVASLVLVLVTVLVGITYLTRIYLLGAEPQRPDGDHSASAPPP